MSDTRTIFRPILSIEEQRDRILAKKFLSKADKILASIDDGSIGTATITTTTTAVTTTTTTKNVNNHTKVRVVPSFDESEIELGSILGEGGFGIVYGIRKFTTKDTSITSTGTSTSTISKDQHNSSTTDNNGQASVEEQSLSTTRDHVQGPISPTPNSSMSIGDEHTTTTKTAKTHQGTSNRTTSIKVGGIVASDAIIDHHDHHDHDDDDDDDLYHHDTGPHYDDDECEKVHASDCENELRIQMINNPCRSNGDPRYALKRLKDNLTILEQARGMVDLAIETKFLSLVIHPNIIKLRGIANCTDLIDTNFFIILDRLQTTLGQQIKTWAIEIKQYHGKLGGLVGRKPKLLNDLLATRITTAYDLASAYSYLHENKIIYRDIKPENIGFDLRGDVKIFDFGLCKKLSSHLRATPEYGYRLTARVGSFPYMAPEVLLRKTYDTKCDVFSFAILLWEILSLKHSFDGMVPDEFVDTVLCGKVRPPINKRWSQSIRHILPEAWDANPTKRPDMNQFVLLLREELNSLTTDEKYVANRTKRVQDKENTIIT